MKEIWKNYISPAGLLTGTVENHAEYFGSTLKKKVYWINKIGVSRGAILICCQLNTIRNWINYFIDWKQKHNNEMYLLNYV